MTKVCEQWSFEELCDMDEADMENLLSHYAENKVVTYNELRGSAIQKASEETSDGGLGWF
jgi:precorrin-2 dehydrogenase/sirohydrochlorin ferrochelatase